MRQDMFFLSHSSHDGDKPALLVEALREATQGTLHFFSTSAKVLKAGSDWRAQVVEAIGYSAATILIATPRSTSSVEVAFELGVATAREKRVLVVTDGSMRPEALPLGLNTLEILNLSIDSDWKRLMHEMATIGNFMGDLKDVNLSVYASQFSPASDISVSRRGHIVEIRNESDQDVLVVSARSLTLGDHWPEFFNGKAIKAGASISAFSSSVTDVNLEIEYEVARQRKQQRFNLDGAQQ